MLTRKQRDLLLFLNQRIKEEGIPPSFDEMKDALQLKSKSGIHRMIQALEDRGFIRRLAHKARALEIIKLPENITLQPSEHLCNSRIKTIPSVSESRDIPLVGRIAAGTPIEALQSTSNLITVPQHMLASHQDHYALEVKGDSMINVGIHDGDIAIIRATQDAKNGEIVVALVEDHEATLKRFQKKGSAIVLEPANPAYDTVLYDSSQVKVQGKLVGLMRAY